jgi:hypothetical protein
VLAEKFVIILTEKLSEGLFAHLFEDKRVEMNEVFAELVKVHFVGLEFPS